MRVNLPSCNTMSNKEKLTQVLTPHHYPKLEKEEKKITLDTTKPVPYSVCHLLILQSPFPWPKNVLIRPTFYIKVFGGA